jgi:2-C-methyl-D-erythritol 2,4-cyclodiphosphate synthase
MSFRIGQGYDIHRTVTGKPLILGGIKIESPFGLDGHSDADCITHAICDAFLGAAGLPDIGHFFPDNDTTWLGADSQVLLRRVLQVLRESGWRPVNLDVTLVAEKPRISRYIGEMKAVLAASTGLPSTAIGLKATTNEGIGDIGLGLAIAAHAVVLVERA